MSDRRGLPTRRQMRHDAHYVETIASRFEEPIGRTIATDLVDPNPLQPRVQLGQLDELVHSIEDHGVLEPLIVRAGEGGRYQLVSGERRLRAAMAAGLTEVPCVEIDVDDAEALEVALVENLLRRDLEALEEADGLAALRQRFDYTHEQLARRLGRSRTVVTETLAIAAIPEPVRELCSAKGVTSRSALLQVARAKGREKMEETVLRIASEGLSRDEIVRSRRQEAGAAKGGRAPGKVFRWQPETKGFTVQIRFRKSRVTRNEILAAIQALLAELDSTAEG